MPNIYFLYSLFINKNFLKKHYEDLLVLGGILFFSFVLILSIKSSNLLDIFTSVISSIGTSGLSFYSPPNNFNLFFVFLTMIGGSILSNSSGIKFLRFYILLKSTLIEILKFVKRIYSPKLLSSNPVYLTSQLSTISDLVFISFF